MIEHTIICKCNKCGCTFIRSLDDSAYTNLQCQRKKCGSKDIKVKGPDHREKLKIYLIELLGYSFSSIEESFEEGVPPKMRKPRYYKHVGEQNAL